MIVHAENSDESIITTKTPGTNDYSKVTGQYTKVNQFSPYKQ
jgi:hypothetical protein